MPDTPLKPCALCGGECDGQPRIKDAKGRYLHRACAEKAARRQPAGAAPDSRPASRPGSKPASGPAPAAAPSGGVMDMLIDDALANTPEACPKCARPTAQGAVICVNCGYNASTGKTLRSQIEKPPKDADTPSGGSTRGRVLASASGFTIEPVLWLIGGCVGGAVGAAIWASLAYFLRVEVGWIAWAVGLLTGVGVLAGARGDGGLLPGLVAAVVSIISVCAGKYVALHYDAADFVEEATQFASSFDPADITDDEVLQYLADQNAEDKLDQDIVLEWPEQVIEAIKFNNDLNKNAEAHLIVDLKDNWSVSRAAIDWAAVWPDGYPDDIHFEVLERWESMPEASRLGIRQQMIAKWEAEAVEYAEEVQQFVHEEGFWTTFNFKDAIFFSLAVASAFGIAFKDF